MSENPVFRKVALERLASPEQLDSLITITRPMGWLALLGMGLLVTAGLAWAIFGSIPTKVDGQGILLAGGGVHQIVPTHSGRLVDVRVREGDPIAEGQAIARVAQPELSAELERVHGQVEALRANVADAGGDANAGLVTELADRETTLDRLQEEFFYASRVVSPASGRVLEVKHKVGSRVSNTEPLVSYQAIREDLRELDAVLFVPAEEGQRILPGMDVQVSPHMVQVEEFGFINGKVISVSDYPLSQQGMMNLLENEELVRRFSGDGALVEVRIELLSDPGTATGYRWSTGTGPAMRLDSGTFVSASVVVEADRPINMIMPLF